MKENFNNLSRKGNTNTLLILFIVFSLFLVILLREQFKAGKSTKVSEPPKLDEPIEFSDLDNGLEPDSPPPSALRKTKVVIDPRRTLTNSAGSPLFAGIVKEIFFNSQGFNYQDPRDGKMYSDTPFLRKIIQSLGGKWGTELYVFGDPPEEGGESDGTIAVSAVDLSECNPNRTIRVDPETGLPTQAFVLHKNECYELDFEHFYKRVAASKALLGFDTLYLLTGMTPRDTSCNPFAEAPSEDDPAKDYYSHIYFGPKDLNLHGIIVKAAFEKITAFSRHLGIRRIIAQVRDEPMSYNFMGSCGPGGPHNNLQRFRDYVELFKVEHKAIKDVDKDIVVIGNGSAAYDDKLGRHVSGAPEESCDNDCFREALAKEEPGIARDYTEAVQSYHWIFTYRAYPELVPEEYIRGWDFESRLIRRHIAKKRAELDLPPASIVIPGWNDNGIPELKPGEPLPPAIFAMALRRTAAYAAGFMIAGLPLAADENLAQIMRADLWPLIGQYYTDEDGAMKSLVADEIINQGFFAVNLDNPNDGRTLPAGQVLQMLAKLAEGKKAYFVSTEATEHKIKEIGLAPVPDPPLEVAAVKEYGENNILKAIKVILVNYNDDPRPDVTVYFQDLAFPAGAKIKAKLRKVRNNGLDLEPGVPTSVYFGPNYVSSKVQMEPFDVVFFELTPE